MHLEVTEGSVDVLIETMESRNQYRERRPKHQTLGEDLSETKRNKTFFFSKPKDYSEVFRR